MLRHAAGLRHPGVAAAFAAALLFGAGMPMAKLLLDSVGPVMFAGLLYLGSGMGLVLYRRLRRLPAVVLAPQERVVLAASVIVGGVVGPVLLLLGLSRLPASVASLLLNAEGVFTALIAWFVFRENVDRRIALGMLAIVAGATVLSWPSEFELSAPWPSLALLGACLAWGIDNNLTRRLALSDATWIAAVKGLGAGLTNLLLAVALGATLPRFPVVAGAMVLGLATYGVSLALFVIALRHLGTARTGAYFSSAPFFGAALAVTMGEPITLRLMVAGALMGSGLWLHLTEHHLHLHRHPALGHEHAHLHDPHHQHQHDGADGSTTGAHSHWHHHEPQAHAHPHYPDAHHRHEH